MKKVKGKLRMKSLLIKNITTERDNVGRTYIPFHYVVLVSEGIYSMGFQMFAETKGESNEFLSIATCQFCLAGSSTYTPFPPIILLRIILNR